METPLYVNQVCTKCGRNMQRNGYNHLGLQRCIADLKTMDITRLGQFTEGLDEEPTWWDVDMVLSLPKSLGSSLLRALPDVSDLCKLSTAMPLAMLAISKELNEATSSPAFGCACSGCGRNGSSCCCSFTENWTQRTWQLSKSRLPTISSPSL